MSAPFLQNSERASGEVSGVGCRVSGLQALSPDTYHLTPRLRFSGFFRSDR